MGKRSSEILNLKHAGQYKYYKKVAHHYKTVILLFREKNLEQSNLRANQGHFRGFDSRTLSDLNITEWRHEMVVDTFPQQYN